MNVRLIGSRRDNPQLGWARGWDVYEAGVGGCMLSLHFKASPNEERAGEYHVYLIAATREMLPERGSYGGPPFVPSTENVLYALMGGMTDPFEAYEIERFLETDDSGADSRQRLFSVETLSIESHELHVGGVIRGWAPVDVLLKLAEQIASCVETESELARRARDDAREGGEDW